MDIQERLEYLHSQLMEYKEHLLHDHGERDMMPVMAAIYDDGPVDMGLEEIVESASAFAEALPPHVRQGFSPPAVGAEFVLTMGKAKHGQVREVAIGMDGYARETDAFPSDHERGSLGKDFANNPTTDVIEVLTTYVITSNKVGGAELAVKLTKYGVDDGNRIVWKDSMSSTHDTSDLDYESLGAVVDAIVPFFTEEALS